MPSRKAKVDKPVVDSNKKVGRPSNNSIEDFHPRLQPNFFKSQAKHILSITHSFGGFLHIGGGKHISLNILAHVR